MPQQTSGQGPTPTPSNLPFRKLHLLQFRDDCCLISSSKQAQQFGYLIRIDHTAVRTGICNVLLFESGEHAFGIVRQPLLLKKALQPQDERTPGPQAYTKTVSSHNSCKGLPTPFRQSQTEMVAFLKQSCIRPHHLNTSYTQRFNFAIMPCVLHSNSDCCFAMPVHSPKSFEPVLCTAHKSHRNRLSHLKNHN